MVCYDDRMEAPHLTARVPRPLRSLARMATGPPVRASVSVHVPSPRLCSMLLRRRSSWRALGSPDDEECRFSDLPNRSFQATSIGSYGCTKQLSYGSSFCGNENSCAAGKFFLKNIAVTPLKKCSPLQRGGDPRDDMEVSSAEEELQGDGDMSIYRPWAAASIFGDSQEAP